MTTTKYPPLGICQDCGTTTPPTDWRCAACVPIARERMWRNTFKQRIIEDCGDDTETRDHWLALNDQGLVDKCDRCSKLIDTREIECEDNICNGCLYD